MKLRRVWWLLPALGLLPVARAETNAPLHNATSVTRQFNAYAPSPILPPALCVFAERLKHEWLARLDTTDNWRDPIVLVIRERTPATAAAAPVTFGIYQVGPMVKYEITCRVPPTLEERALAAAIIEALCLEAANRNRPHETTPDWKSAVIPLWLTQGLCESIQGQPEWLIAVARRAANSARPPGVADVMRRTTLPDDAAERDLFSANAWLLTESLLRLPGGPRKLQQFLAELGAGRPAKDAFRSAYGDEFADAVALEKWSSLKQARLTTLIVPQNLTATETARRLDELLTVQAGLRFNALERSSEQDWLKQMLPGRIREMQGLLAQAHPMYRQAIATYIEAAQWLTVEKLSRYRRAVRQADQQRANIDRQVREIAAVLDHAEQAYGTGTPSKLFQGYFRTLEQMEKFEQQRRNPISDYLDQFDR